MSIDEDTLKRWTNLEIHKANESIVTNGARLSDLLDLEEPVLEARDGSVHRFDPDALARLDEALSPLVRAELELPITFYRTHDATDSCFVADETAQRALDQLGVATSEPREGKLWMGVALAKDFARNWPGVAQFVIR